MEQGLDRTIRICEDRIKQLNRLIAVALSIKALRREGQTDFISNSILYFIRDATDLKHFRISFSQDDQEKYFIAKKDGSLIFAETPRSNTPDDDVATVNDRQTDIKMAHLVAELIVSNYDSDSKSSNISIKASYVIPKLPDTKPLDNTIDTS